MSVNAPAVEQRLVSSEDNEAVAAAVLGAALSGDALARTRLRAKRTAEFRERAVALASAHGGEPDVLLAEVERLVAASRHGGGGPDAPPCELLSTGP